VQTVLTGEHARVLLWQLRTKFEQRTVKLFIFHDCNCFKFLKLIKYNKSLNLKTNLNFFKNFLGTNL